MTRIEDYLSTSKPSNKATIATADYPTFLRVYTEDLPAEVRMIAGFGWCLFPIPLGAKIAAIKEGFDGATREIEKLEQWARMFGGPCNWGLVTGQRSGVYVLEVDGEIGKASLRTLRKAEFENGEPLAFKAGEKTFAFFH